MNGALSLHPKVASSLLASSVVVVIVYSLHQWAHVDLPVEVGGALTTIIAFVAGWLAPSRTGSSTVNVSQSFSSAPPQ